MARLKRDNYYLELMEHVLGGVRVSVPGRPRSRASRLDVTRRSWARAMTSSEKELVVPLTVKLRERE